MKKYQSLSHTRWDCKYHMVFIPSLLQKSTEIPGFAVFGASWQGYNLHKLHEMSRVTFNFSPKI